MQRHSDGGRLTAMIESIAAATPPDRELLSCALVVRCWPGGVSDRARPVALGRLRRSHWLPTPRLECSCSSGYCELCN